MHNYKLLLWCGIYNTTMCQPHANIFIYFIPETLFSVNGFNLNRSGFNSNRSGKPFKLLGKPAQTVCIRRFGLKFEFERF